MQPEATGFVEPQSPVTPPRQPFDPNAQIVRPRHLKAATGLSACQIWRLRRDGRFPQPIRLSVGAIGWRKSDIDSWLVERAAASK